MIIEPEIYTTIADSFGEMYGLGAKAQAALDDANAVFSSTTMTTTAQQSAANIQNTIAGTITSINQQLPVLPSNLSSAVVALQAFVTTVFPTVDAYLDEYDIIVLSDFATLSATVGYPISMSHSL